MAGRVFRMPGGIGGPISGILRALASSVCAASHRSHEHRRRPCRAVEEARVALGGSARGDPPSVGKGGGGGPSAQDRFLPLLQPLPGPHAQGPGELRRQAEEHRSGRIRPGGGGARQGRRPWIAPLAAGVLPARAGPRMEAPPTLRAGRAEPVRVDPSRPGAGCHGHRAAPLDRAVRRRDRGERGAIRPLAAGRSGRASARSCRKPSIG